MKLSNAGLNLIKSFEGCRLTAYKALPNEKYFTIGYGHNGSDVRDNERITQKQALNLLRNDTEKFVEGVNDMVHVALNQNQFDALVSLAYNIGLGAFKGSSLLDFINKRDFKHASEEFDLWVHSGDKVVQGLVTRRQKEKALFLKPVSNPSPTKNYTIEHGDTLSEIAVKFETTVRGLSLLNPQIKDVDKISVGQVIKVPTHSEIINKASFKTYTIKAGDNLIKIAQANRTTVDKILNANKKIINKNIVKAGDIIKIPLN